MKAVKGNKEYTITEAQQKYYQDVGYDIVDNGKVIAYGKGKTVPYDEYVKVKTEVDDLKAKFAAIEAERAPISDEATTGSKSGKK